MNDRIAPSLDFVCPFCSSAPTHDGWPWCSCCHPTVTRGVSSAALAGVAAAAAASWFVGLALLPAVLVCVFFAGMAALALLDWRTMLLPDKLTLPLLWIGLVANAGLGVFTDAQTAVIGAAVGYLVPWAFYWMVLLATGKVGVGYGDFKFLAAIGAWQGYLPLLDVAFVSSSAAMVYVVYLKLTSKGTFTSPFPFGPFLAMGAAAMMFLPTGLMN